MFRRTIPVPTFNRNAAGAMGDWQWLSRAAMLRRDEDYLAWWHILSSQLIATSITLIALMALLSDI
ncbi:MAG: hypothetical protein KDJ45_08360 [Hyphomicrobiaceae bacterium]|nr:hypothetical protein [Hyphomicrobiaceae bacterium]MCC0010029.1 hypothetical protein [Hyphomicrobiaceae bacterium]